MRAILRAKIVMRTIWANRHAGDFVCENCHAGNFALIDMRSIAFQNHGIIMRMIMISVANDLPIFGGRVGGRLRPMFGAVDDGACSCPIPDHLRLAACGHACGMPLRF